MKTTLQRTRTLASAALLLLAGAGSALHAQTPLFEVVRASDQSRVLVANDDGRVGIGLGNPLRALDIAAAGGIRLARTENASANNELFFEDNGQIRSRDNNHRILFDRAGAIMELREFGRIVLSAGATAGQRTGTVEVRTSHVTVNTGLVAGGNVGSGEVIAPHGAGTRMLWYPRKAAFRAGHVEGIQWDDANIGVNSMALGRNNTASGGGSMAMGALTTASGGASTAMGSETTASGAGSTAMGSNTTASGFISTTMGSNTTASGTGSTAMGVSTTASGSFSTAMGAGTTASGSTSTAMGRGADTNGHAGAFVYGDNSTDGTIRASAPNQFVVRASGGFFLRTRSDVGTGCNLGPGSGSWSCTSSLHQKEHFRDEDGEVVLGKIAALPIRSWSYLGEPGAVRHLGPTAEDFRAAFGLGTDDTSIGMLDIAGVSLLAVQALERRTRELRGRTREVESLRSEVAELRAEVERLRREHAADAERLAHLEAAVEQILSRRSRRPAR
jgi:hypothetical protein